VRISCLHADAGSIAEYEDAAPPHLALVHFVSTSRAEQAAASLEAETQLMVSRAARGSDAVLVTCPKLSGIVHPPALSSLDLLARAIKRMKGPVEAVGITGQIPPVLIQTVKKAGATLREVPSPEEDHGLGLSNYLADSHAREIVMLNRRLAYPPDFRIHSAAALALSAMPDTGLPQ